MNRLLEWMWKTDNWALTNKSSLSQVLDMFFLAWASRSMSEKDIVKLFVWAMQEDLYTAIKVLFWARDIRWGAWERRFFRIIFSYLSENHREVFDKITPYISDIGRWDDLFYDTSIVDKTMWYIKKSISLDNWLLFKWLPREKSANSSIAKKIIKALWISAKEYRKLLSKNSRTVEQQMSAKNWSDIAYQSVPSVAFNLYRNAFYRNDEDRFKAFVEKVKNWETKINASAIFPVDIFLSYIKWGDIESINAQWQNLPNYLNDENILPVIDTSGSMGRQERVQSRYSEYYDRWAIQTPFSVAVSLWIYLAERTQGIFKDHFITFEGKPKLRTMSGSPTDRMEQVGHTLSDCNTNLLWVFELLLSVAKEKRLEQSELPNKILIISDMEFDSVGWNRTNFKAITEAFEASGYKVPWLIFWNVNWRIWNSPVNINDNNVALVSGYSPAIVKSILWWEDLSPLWVMNKAIEKYKFIDLISF